MRYGRVAYPRVNHMMFFSSQTLSKLLIVVTSLSVSFCSCAVHAEQLSFSKTATDKDYQFSYQWLDFNNQQQNISFTLTPEALFERFRHLKSYQSNYAQKTILRRMKLAIKKQPPKGMQVNFRQVNGEFSIEVKGQDQQKVAQAYQALLKLEKDISDEYFRENYYQLFTNHDQVNGIKMNHVDIANDSVADLKVLKAIILDQVSIQNIREVTNYVLSFVQNIPYSTLESRITSSGSGFNPPAKLLWENQGDCDSKMALTAAILRALMPRIEMAMIYIDGHAFIGIAINKRPGEVTVEHDDISYVLAEPTGPALLPVGKLAPESELAINQGRYIIEKYHEVLSSELAEN